VAKASGSFAVDSLQFRLPEIGLELKSKRKSKKKMLHK
jgi:hypothetical protein